MANKLSFKDINITFKKHPVTGDVVVSKDASAIKKAIVNLLLTNKSENLFNPEYGSDIRAYLFEPLDYGTAAQIQRNIAYSVNKHEPRVQIEDLRANPNFDDNGFDVEMTYSVRGSNDIPVTVDFFLARTR